jgi:hypothetical protein
MTRLINSGPADGPDRSTPNQALSSLIKSMSRTGSDHALPSQFQGGLGQLLRPHNLV